MPSVSMPTAMLAGSALSAGASIFGGSNAAGASKEAAMLQYAAAMEAQKNTMEMFHTTQGNLAPFLAAGTNALPSLQGLTGANPGGNPLTAPLTKPYTPWNPTMEGLAQTPGYQFNLDQGLKGVQNSYAAQGLAKSGSAMKGAASFASGLASNTYQQQFANWQQGFADNMATNQNIFQMLSGQATMGQNAAAQTGSLGAQATASANNFLTQGAAAQASGIVGSANAQNASLSGIAGAGNNALSALAMQNYFSGGGGASAGTGGLYSYSGGGAASPGTGGLYSYT